MNKKCIVCGKEFKVTKDHRCYCSTDCKFKQKRYIGKKKHKTITTFESISEINKKALSLGMSYGEYVAKFL